jgi:rhomboid protease GluP
MALGNGSSMNASQKRNSLLCPNCRRLVSRSAPACPYCGLKKPGSIWKDNIFTRISGDDTSILRLILIANIVMFVLSLAIDPRATSFSGHPFGFLTPSNGSLLVLGATGSVPLFHYQHWWSLISASYLHGSLIHIVFNMIALHQLGPLIIREYGVSRTIVIYTLSGIGGYFISALVGVRLTIGASAAVCGLIGAALYYGKNRGGTYGSAVYRQIGGWAVGIFIFGLLVPGINNWGHGGGMLAGAAIGAVMGYQERVPETIRHKFLGTVCIIATGAVLLWSVVNAVLLFFR